MHRVGGIAIVVAMTLAATAGDAAGQRARFGMRGGVHLGTWGGADVDNFETALGGSVTSRTGFVGGGFLSFPLGGLVRLQPELLYIGKGAKIEVGGGSAAFVMSYLEIPVLLVLTPRVTGSVRPAVLAGGAVGVRLSCRISGGGTSDSCSNQGLNTKSVDYGVVFGGQLGFGYGSGEIQIGGRYSLGLGKIFDASPSVAINNRGLSFTAGYLFRVGR